MEYSRKASGGSQIRIDQISSEQNANEKILIGTVYITHAIIERLNEILLTPRFFQISK